MTGDARYLSHRDAMRLWQRAAVRCSLPLRYSAGFNPRCRLSIPLPRNVAMASRCQCVLIELEDACDVQAVVQCINRTVPEGVVVTGGRLLEGRRRTEALDAKYVVDLAGVSEKQRDDLAKRLREFGRQDHYEVLRTGGKKNVPWISVPDSVSCCWRMIRCGLHCGDAGRPRPGSPSCLGPGDCR